MSLINSIKLLKQAQKNHKAVGAFNILNLEMLQGVIKAAEKMKTPVICQISSGAMKWAKFEYIVPLALSAARSAEVEIAIHLDHCQDITLLKKVVEAGFLSVMYDGSHFPLNINIAESQEVIKYCKGRAQVEIEIGKVGGKEDDLISNQNERVNLAEVIAFYHQTKPDSLAVAFGTAHGIYKQKNNLDFALIQAVAKAIPVPLVMHGTSGVPFEQIAKAIKSGITKVNVGTDLLIVYNKAIRAYFLLHPEAYDIRKINSAGINAITQRVEKYLKLFNQ